MFAAKLYPILAYFKKIVALRTLSQKTFFGDTRAPIYSIGKEKLTLVFFPGSQL